MDKYLLKNGIQYSYPLKNLNLHIDSQKCSLYQSTHEHTHTDTNHKSRLPKESRKYILEQVQIGVKKNCILIKGLISNGKNLTFFIEICNLTKKINL